MSPKRVVKPEMLEAIMKTLDRQVLQAQEPGVIRRLVSGAMRKLGYSQASLLVSVVVTMVAQQWGLDLTKRPKPPAPKKPPKREKRPVGEVPLSTSQQAAMLAPHLRRLYLRSLRSNAPASMPFADFRESARLALIEEGVDVSPQAFDELICWLDDNDYLLLSDDRTVVEVIAIPVAPPTRAPVPHPDSE